MFLHGELEELIYIKQLNGFTILGKEDHVYLLKKSLCGLKQYKRFDAFKANEDYLKNQIDNYIYFRRLKDGPFIYSLLYVDHMLMVAKNMSDIDVLKR